MWHTINRILHKAKNLSSCSECSLTFYKYVEDKRQVENLIIDVNEWQKNCDNNYYKERKRQQKGCTCCSSSSHSERSPPLWSLDLFLGKIKTRVLPLPRLPTSSLKLFCHLKQFGILSLCRMLETGFDVSEQISTLPFERSIFTRRRTLQLINV